MHPSHLLAQGGSIHHLTLGFNDIAVALGGPSRSPSAHHSRTGCWLLSPCTCLPGDFFHHRSVFSLLRDLTLRERPPTCERQELVEKPLPHSSSKSDSSEMCPTCGTEPQLP